MKQLTLLFVADGSSIHTRRWLQFFAERHKVYLLSIPPLSESAGLDANVTLLNKRTNRTIPIVHLFLYWLQLIRAARHLRPDLIHAHLLVPNAWLAAASFYRPFVTTAWGSDLLRSGWLSRRLNGWAARKAALNTGDSQELIEKFVELGCKPQRTALIQWGVDTKRFSPEQDGSELRRKLAIPESAPVLVSPRIMQPLYNTDTIAKAFCIAATQHADLHLVLSEYRHDPEYRKQVVSILEAAGIMERVRLTPALSYGEMPQLYGLADIMISVPSSDSTPVSLLEAMSSGTPVIVSDLPSIREWITDNKNGTLVPAKNPGRLAQAILETLSLDEITRKHRAEYNRSVILERADHYAFMKQMEGLYFDIASKRK